MVFSGLLETCAPESLHGTYFKKLQHFQVKSVEKSKTSYVETLVQSIRSWVSFPHCTDAIYFAKGTLL